MGGAHPMRGLYCGPIGPLPVIHVPPMSKGDNNHQQDVVLDCVNNPTIANADPEARTAAQGNRLGRPGIGPQECDGAVDTIAVLGVDLIEGPKGGRT